MSSPPSRPPPDPPGTTRNVFYALRKAYEENKKIIESKAWNGRGIIYYNSKSCLYSVFVKGSRGKGLTSKTIDQLEQEGYRKLSFLELMEHVDKTTKTPIKRSKEILTEIKDHTYKTRFTGPLDYIGSLIYILYKRVFSSLSSFHWTSIGYAESVISKLNDPAAPRPAVRRFRAAIPAAPRCLHSSSTKVDQRLTAAAQAAAKAALAGSTRSHSLNAPPITNLPPQLPGVSESYTKMPRIPPDVRKSVTESVHEFTVNSSRVLSAEILQKIEYTQEPGCDGALRSTHMFGRYDVLSTPCIMDYNYAWTPNPSGGTPFLVHHAAAINIGETPDAPPEDFEEFSEHGKLKEEAYLESMERIFSNLLEAQAKSGVTHAVWVPFGMGAFLRHLPNHDRSYENPEKMQALRERIAERFIKTVVSKCPPPIIHLCLLSSVTNGQQTDPNCNAFYAVLNKAAAQARGKITLHLNVDAPDLAQRLANAGRGREYTVSLANAANRNLLGNHWYDSSEAMNAIDENLHRRSRLLSRISYNLNGRQMPTRDDGYSSRRAEYLKNQIALLKAQAEEKAKNGSV